MKTVLSGGELASSNGAFERRRGGNGILASNTKTVEEQRPGIADDPALESQTPAGRQHKQTDKHDESILDKTPTTTNPITNNLASPNVSSIFSESKMENCQTYTDDNLANHDTNDFQVGDTGNPVLAANLVAAAPTLGPNLLEERLKVANGEENVALKSETGTRNDGVTEVPGDGGERVLANHLADGLQFLGGSLAIDIGDEAEALAPGQIGPVHTFGGVRVVGTSDMAEDATLNQVGSLVRVVVDVMTAGPVWYGDLARYHGARHALWLGCHCG